MSHASTRLFSAIALFGLALGGIASAQIIYPAPKAPDPNERAASLVRQDQSDCQNGNVNDSNPSLVGGAVWVVRGSDGTTKVRVGLSAKPSTTYHFFLKCVRILGDIQTDDEGSAVAEFSFSTNEAGTTFAFDMYPEGAPPGNKYQSMSVKY
jgi:hypothetical protein